MNRQLRALGFGFAILSVTGFTFARHDGFSVRRQPKEGQIVKLRFKAVLEIQSSQATLTGLVQDKTTKVNSDGSYEEEEQQTEGVAKIGDQSFPSPVIGPFPIVHNADGSLRELRGNDTVAGPDAYRMSTLELLIDSGHPLNVGDSWTADIKADPKTGVQAAKADYKILGEEKIGEFDTLKIRMTIKETQGATPASSEGTVWINKADGTIVKAEMKWTNAPFPGAPAPMNASMTETRES